MRFTKLHGLGNDYLFVNCFVETVVDPGAVARAISDRHRGVGSDGLILICPSDVGDVRMEMYNADGSRGPMCGNGLRCLVKYAYERRLCSGRLVRVETDSGIRLAECFLEGDRVVRVRAAMGPAGYLPDVVDAPFEVNGRTLSGTYVCTGSEHLVVFVEDWSEVNLYADGPALEHAPRFPQGINVHFALAESPSEVRVLTWERGSGPTQACGTGACAVADAAFTHDLAVFPVTVHLPGGDLLIERVGGVDRRAWAAGVGVAPDDPRYDLGDDTALLMTGPAEEVFSAEWLG